MKLLEKLETLVDEVTELVKEERKRRNLPWPYSSPLPDLYGPRGTEINFGNGPGGGSVPPGSAGGT